MSLADEILNVIVVPLEKHEDVHDHTIYRLLDRVRQLEKDAELGRAVRQMPEMLNGLDQDGNADYTSIGLVINSYANKWSIERWYDGEPEEPVCEGATPDEALIMATQVFAERIKDKTDYEQHCREADEEDKQKAALSET